MITTDPEAVIVAEAAVAQLARPADELLFVYLSDCDRAGHESGWMSEGYLAAVRRVDAAVGILTAQLGDATLLVVADHGGGGVHARDHDLEHPLNERIPLIVAGKWVRRRTVVHRDVSLLDVPPTVLAALDLPVPAEYEGRALTEALLPRHSEVPMGSAGGVMMRRLTHLGGARFTLGLHSSSAASKVRRVQRDWRRCWPTR